MDVTPGYYYDAVKLQQMVATPDMVHKTLAEDHNLMDAEQIMDTGNDMDTVVAEVAELLCCFILWNNFIHVSLPLEIKNIKSRFHKIFRKN